MKKDKYFIYFECCEVEMSKEMEISKKEYQRQLQHLTSQLSETKDWDTPMEVRINNFEDDKLKYEINRFDVATGSTYLKKITCKDGYCFKTKKEMVR